MKTLQLIGRRWFDRTYGNTYNSVAIYVDGELVASLPYGYGYADYYLQRAMEWLEKNGYATLQRHDNGSTE
jgi:hypothetical protein